MRGSSLRRPRQGPSGRTMMLRGRSCSLWKGLVRSSAGSSRTSHASAAAREAAEKLPNVIRIGLTKSDAPTVNVSLPGVAAWLLLPTIAEGSLRELLLRKAAGTRGGSSEAASGSTEGGDPWEDRKGRGGAGRKGEAAQRAGIFLPGSLTYSEMVAAGSDVLLLEGAMDVGLETVGSDLFERAVTAGRCHVIRDARLY